MTDAEDVLRAAADLVAAFGRTDTEAYFEAFADQATFLFHTTPGVLASRAEYEALWRSWLDDGFRVHGCESSDQTVTFVGHGGAVAVFTHRVRTDVTVGGERSVLQERETIVFARSTGRWLAVHEHLSPDPAS
jgi:ketosteroid isomerase-like protein